MIRRDKEHVTSLLEGYTGYTNQEVGQILGVTGATIGNWRNYFDIPRGSLFFRRFAAKYGQEGLNTFEAMLDAGSSYAAIGYEFGVSRERVRQIASEHFGVTRKHDDKSEI